MNCNAILAVARRQLGSFLGNPLGYIFMLAFVCLTGVLLFSFDDYFKRGIADLWYIANSMPLLLAVLLPALSMGAWTIEREQGTDELILTLPMTTADAVIGKYLAIVVFYTLALVANLSNVIVLGFLGSPDTGLVLSTWIGWWCCGLAFAAVSLWASVQVRSQAIAFVLGTIYCSILMLAGWQLEWVSPFTHGLLSIGSLLLSLAAVVVGLGMSIVTLSARLWQAERTSDVGFQIANLLLAVLLAVNLGQIAGRHYIDVDVSTDDVSSLSEASSRILATVETPVEISLFVSDDDILQQVPVDVQRKAKEVLDISTAIERSSGGRVTVRVLRPAEAGDEIALMAENDHELSPREIPSDSIAGQGTALVYLGAVIQASGVNQKIPYFEPGVSVEYELVRAVRGVDRGVRREATVIGVASTEIEMNGGFDMQRGQPTPAWTVVEELRKQYEVRGVDLAGGIADDIEVLVVPMPSGLTQDELLTLHDWIWKGGATLLLEDPYPYFEIHRAQRLIAPLLPRFQQPMGGRRPPPPPPKGDAVGLYDALGLRFDLGDITWSKYQPSRDTSRWPPTMVWSSAEHGGVRENEITTGLDAMLTMSPGAIYKAGGADKDLTITPLLSPNSNAHFGRNRFSDYIVPEPYPRWADAPPTYEHERDQIPWLAVRVTGTMGRAFAAEPDEEAEEGGDDGAAEDDPALKVGASSPQPVNVVVIADLDIVSDDFYQVDRLFDQRQSPEAFQKLLATLDNVRFVANAIDVLAGEGDFLAVRARQPGHRPLSAIRERIAASEEAVNLELEEAQKALREEIKAAEDAIEDKVAEINARDDLDLRSKQNTVLAFRRQEENRLAVLTEKLNKDLERDVRIIRGRQQRELKEQLFNIKVLAIGIPALFLLLLVLVVTVVRLTRERIDIPNHRKRGVA